MTDSGRLLLLGHRGMLGHVVARTFVQAGWDVVTTNERFDGRSDGAFFSAISAANCDVIVNAIAAGPGAASPEMLLVNGVLPQLLATQSGDALLIQPSSDAVFSGRRGAYAVGEAADASDSYGMSKRLGERCVEFGRAIVLRTSVIGPDLGDPIHLLSWYLAQERAVQGYTDVRWNGITSLEWAKLALRAAQGGIAAGIHQPASPEVVTKAALLAEIRAAYGRGVEITASPSGAACDRSLLPTQELPPIAAQLRELAEWYGR